MITIDSQMQLLNVSFLSEYLDFLLAAYMMIPSARMLLNISIHMYQVNGVRSPNQGILFGGSIDSICLAGKYCVLAEKSACLYLLYLAAQVPPTIINALVMKTPTFHKLAKALLIYETLSGDEIRDLILKIN